MLCLTLPCWAGDRQVRIVSLELPPDAGSQLEARGMCIEIIKSAFQRAGYEAKIEFYAWQRAVEMAKRGMADCIGNLWYTDRREEWFAYSDSLGIPSRVGFFKSKALDIRFSGYKELAPYTIGYIHGFAYSREFFKETTGFRKIVYYTPAELIEALVIKRIDLALTMKRNGEFLLTNHFSEHRAAFGFMDPPIEVRDEFLGFSKKSRGYQKKLIDFNQGLARIKQNGTVAEILSRHDYEKYR